MQKHTLFISAVLGMMICFFAQLNAQCTAAEGVLEETSANARILKETATLGLAKVHRLEVWAAEPASPQKSMRVGVMEADLREYLTRTKSISHEFAQAAHLIPKLDNRIRTEALAEIGENVLATEQILSVHLAELVSAIHSEDFIEAAFIGMAMDTDFHTLKIHAQTTLLQIRRIDRNLLH